MIYDFILHLYALGAVLSKRRKNLGARLGKNFPEIHKGKDRLVWIHAVSFGETKAIAPLIKLLRQSHPQLKILLSSATETGHNEGKKTIPEANWHVYLPFDFAYIIKPIVKRVAPDLVVLTETDFWLNFQESAKESGAQIVVVNGKLSERSFNRLRKVPSFTKRLFGSIDHFFLQAKVYETRFNKLGIPTSKLSVTGNIKLDSSQIAPQTSTLPILTLGSTHAPEEKMWIAALKEIWKSRPDLKVMLVPRHPERFEEVAKLLADSKVAFGRLSQGDSLETSSLLLIDAMGLLKKCYQQSMIAFVGGSFTEKVGGHNIIEPCFYGIPVIFGPEMHSQPDLLELVQSYHAGLQITPEEMVPTVLRLLSGPQERARLGGNGLKLIEDSKGALQTTFINLVPYIYK